MASRETGGIPITKRSDNWHPSARDLSTTPGGSIYATTPGGSRILYDRNALLYLRNSPLSKTPTNLPVIPGITTGPVPDAQSKSTSVPLATNTNNNKPKQSQDDQEDLFVMEK